MQTKNIQIKLSILLQLIPIILFFCPLHIHPDSDFEEETFWGEEEEENLFGKETIDCTVIQSDYNEENTKSLFFQGIEEYLIEEYQICTGDSVISDIDSILKWKNSINLRVAMPEYKTILKEFILHTGLVKEMLPCEVLNWYIDRLIYINKKEESLKETILHTADKVIDSIAMTMELKNNPRSGFDFDSIPFGLSKKVFLKLYKSFNNYPLMQKKKCLCAEHYPIKGESFFIKFTFNENDQYHRYEIESYLFSADSLDAVIRPLASILKEYFTTLFKRPPNRTYRIGYFDIKSKTVSPYAQWKSEKHRIKIGIGMRKNRYYTKAIVYVKN